MTRLFLVSFVIAAIAVVVPPALFYAGTVGSLTLFYPQSMFVSSDLLLLAWLVVFVLAWRRFRWWSLPLLLGAPFVLVWPIWLTYVLWSCGGACS